MNRQELVSRLTTCDFKQESVETVSQWIIFHKAHAKEIVDIWTTECQRAPVKRILIFFYIANDVIQRSRKKNTEFPDLFCEAFKQLFASGLLLKCDQQVNSSIRRTLQILKTRGFFSDSQILELRQTIAKTEVCDFVHLA